MDEAKTVRGRSKGKPESTTPKLRECRYCKGKFEVNPAFHWKEFCNDTHRKLFWRYGSQSIGKLAERIERDMRKLIAAELAPLRARLDALETPLEWANRELAKRGGADEWPDPEAGEPANLPWDEIDAARREHETRAKRGGVGA